MKYGYKKKFVHVTAFQVYIQEHTYRPSGFCRQTLLQLAAWHTLSGERQRDKKERDFQFCPQQVDLMRMSPTFMEGQKER